MGTGFEFNTVVEFNHPGNPGWGLCVNEGFHIYPMMQPIPLLQDGEDIIAMVEVWKLEHGYENGKAVTTVRYNILRNIIPGDKIYPVSQRRSAQCLTESKRP